MSWDDFSEMQRTQSLMLPGTANNEVNPDCDPAIRQKYARMSAGVFKDGGIINGNPQQYEVIFTPYDWGRFWWHPLTMLVVGLLSWFCFG